MGLTLMPEITLEIRLLLAASFGKKDVAELLISGAEIKDRDKNGKTASAFAIKGNESKECIKLLIDAKLELSDLFEFLMNTKIDFFNRIPSGVVMTKTQIMQLGELEIKEEEINSKGIISFDKNSIKRGEVLSLYANKEIVDEIIRYSVTPFRIKLLLKTLNEHNSKQCFFKNKTNEIEHKSTKLQENESFFTKYLNFFVDFTNLLG